MVEAGAERQTNPKANQNRIEGFTGTQPLAKVHHLLEKE